MTHDYQVLVESFVQAHMTSEENNTACTMMFLEERLWNSNNTFYLINVLLRHQLEGCTKIVIAFFKFALYRAKEVKRQYQEATSGPSSFSIDENPVTLGVISLLDPVGPVFDYEIDNTPESDQEDNPCRKHYLDSCNTGGRTGQNLFYFLFYCERRKRAFSFTMQEC